MTIWDVYYDHLRCVLWPFEPRKLQNMMALMWKVTREKHTPISSAYPTGIRCVHACHPQHTYLRRFRNTHTHTHAHILGSLPQHTHTHAVPTCVPSDNHTNMHILMPIADAAARTDAVAATATLSTWYWRKIPTRDPQLKMSATHFLLLWYFVFFFVFAIVGIFPPFSMDSIRFL